MHECCERSQTDRTLNRGLRRGAGGVAGPGGGTGHTGDDVNNLAQRLDAYQAQIDRCTGTGLGAPAERDRGASLADARLLRRLCISPSVRPAPLPLSVQYPARVRHPRPRSWRHRERPPRRAATDHQHHKLPVHNERQPVWPARHSAVLAWRGAGATGGGRSKRSAVRT
jgi:hypothetical protein